MEINVGKNGSPRLDALEFNKMRNSMFHNKIQVVLQSLPNQSGWVLDPNLLNKIYSTSVVNPAILRNLENQKEPGRLD